MQVSAPQFIFLTYPTKEILYGGAAGGGKSVALLIAALQYVTASGYNAILFRRTISDLLLPDALIPLSHDFLRGTDAKWNGNTYRWTFPSGATLSFGYLQTENDKYRYKGAAFHFCGFDELTQFSETQYKYLFSRLRKSKDSPIPLRMRAASNPGDVGHQWVYDRFVSPNRKKSRVFIPVKKDENPWLDQDTYDESLQELDNVTRQQLKHGDWEIRPEGNLFKRQWFDIVENVPPLKRVVRSWDLAATEEEAGKDPDYTAGVKIGIDDENICYVTDIARLRGTPSEVQRVIKQTAELDGKNVTIRMEQEPGSSGKSLVDHYGREVLFGYSFNGVPSSGDKVTRSNPFSSACERRGVKLLNRSWVPEFLDELTAFPVVAHDDQVDAAVGAFSGLTDLVSVDSGFFVMTAKD